MFKLKLYRLYSNYDHGNGCCFLSYGHIFMFGSSNNVTSKVFNAIQIKTSLRTDRRDPFSKQLSLVIRDAVTEGHSKNE